MPQPFLKPYNLKFCSVSTTFPGQVSRGLRHLAEQGILHRDVALRNILLTNNDVVKVITSVSNVFEVLMSPS